MSLKFDISLGRVRATRITIQTHLLGNIGLFFRQAKALRSHGAPNTSISLLIFCSFTDRRTITARSVSCNGTRDIVGIVVDRCVARQVLSRLRRLIGVQANAHGFTRHSTPYTCLAFLIGSLVTSAFSVVRSIPSSLGAGGIQGIIDLIILRISIRILRISNTRRSITLKVGSSLLGLLLTEAQTKNTSPIAPDTGIALLIRGRITSILLIISTINASCQASNIVGGLHSFCFFFFSGTRDSRKLVNQGVRLFFGNTDTMKRFSLTPNTTIMLHAFLHVIAVTQRAGKGIAFDRPDKGEKQQGKGQE